MVRSVMSAEHDGFAEAKQRIGATLGEKFVLKRVLGVGGMGAVYEAENTWTGRHVAVKVLQHEMSANSEAIRRFQQEARASTKINHPNIIEVLDICREPDGTFFIVSELLNGESLEDRLQRERSLSPVDAMQVILPCGGALARAHQYGVIHRDIKPDNLFLHRDIGQNLHPKVIDFGISKIFGDAGVRAKTQTGMIFGTIEYMSPEQARGDKNIGPQTDIWSLAVVLYRALSGRLPYNANNVNMLLVEIATQRPVPLLVAAPRVPASLAAIIDRALEPDLRERYLRMEHFLSALMTWFEQNDQLAKLRERLADSWPKLHEQIAAEADVEFASKTVSLDPAEWTEITEVALTGATTAMVLPSLPLDSPPATPPVSVGTFSEEHHVMDHWPTKPIEIYKTPVSRVSPQKTENPASATQPRASRLVLIFAGVGILALLGAIAFAVGTMLSR